MSQTLDLIAVLALVAVAIAYLWRRLGRKHRRSAAGESCSGCGRCGSVTDFASRQHPVG